MVKQYSSCSYTIFLNLSFLFIIVISYLVDELLNSCFLSWIKMTNYKESIIATEEIVDWKYVVSEQFIFKIASFFGMHIWYKSLSHDDKGIFLFCFGILFFHTLNSINIHLFSSLLQRNLETLITLRFLITLCFTFFTEWMLVCCEHCHKLLIV